MDLCLRSCHSVYIVPQAPGWRISKICVTLKELGSNASDDLDGPDAM
jgi:hypothetical protein